MAFGSTDKRKYTYSGADVRAYAYFEGFGANVALLDSMHTISYSIHEAKGDARSLGFRGIKGFSRGIRMVAGSIIMVVLQDNPFAPIMDLLTLVETSPGYIRPGWSFDRDLNGVGRAIDSTDFTRRFAAALPPFNILLQYVAESNNWIINKQEVDQITNGEVTGKLLETSTLIDGAAVLLSGVDIVDEGMVTSVNDAYTEITYSFKALDCKPISIQQFKAQISTELLPPEEDPATIRARMLNELLYGSDYIEQTSDKNAIVNQGF